MDMALRSRAVLLLLLNRVALVTTFTRRVVMSGSAVGTCYRDKATLSVLCLKGAALAMLPPSRAALEVTGRDRMAFRVTCINRVA